MAGAGAYGCGGGEESAAAAAAGGMVLSWEAAVQSLNGIIQLHFEKTLEKKRAVDAQKQELWRLLVGFFVFLAVASVSWGGGGGGGRMACRHVWAPVGLLTLGHAAVYAAVAHHLRCINGFRYQRRCHKLTLALATDRLKHIKASSIALIHYGAVILVFDRYSLPNFGAGGEPPPVMAGEIEIPYQEPPESYLGKFKRSWAMHFGFLMCTFGFMVSSAVVILCF
ncbi:hypothetical protein ACMD2_15780 [Ananas comosus]|uniref:Uncharacterized protein n=1 Tax=Ananas comosus TaxID=4615 RepID=A0A199VN96_ANACO|nr:hypothetical protein ACMD2_15780 [Ananas comosus]